MRVLTLLPFWLFLTLHLTAQIVTGDGSVVYFFSNLVPRGSNLASATRLYRYTVAKGVEIEATLQLDGLVDRLGTLETSTDASVVSYWSQRSPLSPNPFCITDPTCYYPITFTGRVGPADKPGTFPRAASVNRSGRYAVLYDDKAPPERIDLVTGERFNARTGVLAAPQQAMTADGQLLIATYPSDNTQSDNKSVLFLSSPSGPTPVGTIAFGRGSSYFVTPPYQSTAQVSANGATVAWANRNDNTMHAIDVRSGMDRVIPNPAGYIAQYLVTDAGDRVLFLAHDASGGATQLYVGRTDGSATFTFSGAPEGVSSAAFTSDGSAIFALTATSRLLKIDTFRLEATELIPETPQISLPTGGALRVAPGSYYRLTGSALNRNVRIGSTALQVRSEKPDELRVQVPFEAQAMSDYLHIASNSPLEQAFPAEIRTLSPKFLTYFDAAIKDPLDQQAVVVHGDYSALVTQSNPARLGETLHLYLSGLGAVTPLVATGAPSPANPPAVVTTGVQVTAFSQNVPVLFIGLAPGMTGVYLMSMRLPSRLELPEPIVGEVPPQPTTVLLRLIQTGASDQAFAFFSAIL